MQKHTTTISGFGTRAVLLSAMAISAGVLSGCRDERTNEPPRQFIPDMDDGPKFKPQAGTELFADGRTMRAPAAHTVAFGESYRVDDVARRQYLKDTPEYFSGVDTKAPPPKADAVLGAAGVKGVSYVAYMPPMVIDDVIARAADRGERLDRPGAMQAMFDRGQERFNIFCSVCHGYEGEGGDPARFSGGLVGRRWLNPVPSFHDAKYKDRALQTGQDGYIFHVIRNGVPDADLTKAPKMPSYKDRVNEADAWAIVYYLRVLQGTRHEDLKTVPAEFRSKLESSRPSLSSADAPNGAAPVAITSKEARQ